jgi:hypothetical protein
LEHCEGICSYLATIVAILYPAEAKIWSYSAMIKENWRTRVQGENAGFKNGT